MSWNGMQGIGDGRVPRQLDLRQGLLHRRTILLEVWHYNVLVL